MNAQETTGIRELTAQEVDHVSGGQTTGYDQTVGLVIGLSIGIVGSVIGGILGWLFGD